MTQDINVDHLKTQVLDKYGVKHLALDGFDELLDKEPGWMTQYMQDNPAVRVYVMANSAPSAFQATSIIDSIPFNLIEWVLNFMVENGSEELAKVAEQALKYLPLVKMVLELV